MGESGGAGELPEQKVNLAAAASGGDGASAPMLEHV